MQHSDTRAASRRRPAPGALLAATLLAALNGGTQAQTALPADPTAQGSAAAAAPGFPAPVAPAAGAVGAAGQGDPASAATPPPQGVVPGPGAAPVAPAPQAATPPPPAAPLSGTTPVQPFPGATMGAPAYNAAVPQPVRPGAMPHPGRPSFGAAPQAPAARAPVPALPTVQSPPVKGLPADAPKLVINGGVHSPNPARRRVIVNGQVVREGADLGAGVVLQQIRPDSVVLGFRGEQFHVVY